jgi:hypothetical protein
MHPQFVQHAASLSRRLDSDIFSLQRSCLALDPAAQLREVLIAGRIIVGLLTGIPTSPQD